MSLFVCDKCDCVENTALCWYATHLIEKTPLLCSACDPEIAKWHGEFDQEKYDPAVDKGEVINR